MSKIFRRDIGCKQSSAVGFVFWRECLHQKHDVFMWSNLLFVRELDSYGCSAS